MANEQQWVVDDSVQPAEPQTTWVVDEAELASDPLPEYANGASPKTALNTGILTATERLQLRGLGNDRGVLKALEARFGQDGAVLDDNGSFKVKNPKTGLWHEVDPKTFDASDPIEMTKSIVGGMLGTAAVGLAAASEAVGATGISRALGLTKEFNPLVIADQLASVLGDGTIGRNAREAVGEVAENLPIAAGIAASTVAMPATVAGVIAAGLVAGGTTIIRNTLGKLAGTYQATPEEELKEVAIDTLLGSIGQAIPVGGKMALDKLAKRKAGLAMQELGENLAKDPGMFDNILETYSAYTGMPKRVFNTYFREGNAVQRVMDRVADADPVNQARGLADVGVETAQRAANLLERTSDDLWNSNFAQLERHIDDSMEFNLKELTDSWATKLEEVGLVRTVNEVTERADEVVRGVTGGTRAIGESGIRDVAEAGATVGTRTMRAKKEFLSLDEFRDNVIKSGDFSKGDAAFSDQTYREIKRLWNRVNDIREKAPSMYGKEGFRETMQVQKILRDMTFKMRQAGIGSADNVMIRRAAEASEQFEKSMAERMLGGTGEGSLGGAFLKMNDTWSSLADATKPFSAAVKRGDTASMARLSKQLIATKPTAANINAKVGLERAQAIMESAGLKTNAAEMKMLQQDLRALEATEYMHSIANKPYLSTAGSGMSGGFFLAGEPLTASAVIANSVVRNPRAAKAMIDLNQKTSHIIKGAGGKALKALTQDPKYYRSILGAGLDAYQSQVETEQALMQQFQQGQP